MLLAIGGRAASVWSVALRYGTVSFLSDYGLRDEFVGVTKSVVWAGAPEVRIVDVTHDIASHDVRAGGLALARAAQYLNPGVVLAVVDPGVGSDRKAIAVEVGDGMSVLIGPDNGLLAPAVALVGGASRAFDISDSQARMPAAGPTFDGRDLFAPVAAQLCLGVPLEELGTEIEPSQLMPAVVPVSEREGDEIVAEVLWIDRFGNCQLNLDPDELGTDSSWRLMVDERPRPVKKASTFDEVASGEIGLIIDSYGMLALVAHRSSAARDLGLREGSIVRLAARGSAPVGVTTPVELERRDR